MAPFTFSLSLLSMAVVLTVVSAAAVAPVFKSCLAANSGRVSCRLSPLLSHDKAPPSSVRQNAQGCAMNDYQCLNDRALYYVNGIRQRHGVNTPLGPPTVSMLNNAVDHSMSFEYGAFQHQDLASVNPLIQCGIFCSGENIAMSSASTNDPAYECTNMWENSPEHLANILNTNDVTAIGIYQAQPNGQGPLWTYCTQTFGLNNYGMGTMNGPNCDIV